MQTIAKQLLTLLDLTSLNADDSSEKITELCRHALTPYGCPAAVCVYPRFVVAARRALARQGTEAIAVATVVNFPNGRDTLKDIATATRQALTDGAQEIDMVMPYQVLLEGDETLPRHMVREIAELTHAADAKLKVIIESGALQTQENIHHAVRIAIEGGADFIKTSTGKTAIGATPQAVTVICRAIVEDNAESRVGIKVSGGVRTFDQAQCYLNIIREHFGVSWVAPEHIRFGASSLLANIIEHLDNQADKF